MASVEMKIFIRNKVHKLRADTTRRGRCMSAMTIRLNGKLLQKSENHLDVATQLTEVCTPASAAML